MWNRVLEPGLVANLHTRQAEHQAVVVRQKGNVVVSTHIPQPKVLFKELVGRGDVRDVRLRWFRFIAKASNIAEPGALVPTSGPRAANPSEPPSPDMKKT